MRFFKWVRYWYRRLRFGPFNEITIPAVAQPWPTIDAATLCSVNPMQTPEPTTEWVPKEVTTTEALHVFVDGYKLFLEGIDEWLEGSLDADERELAGYSLEQFLMERMNLLFWLMLGKRTAEQDAAIVEIKQCDEQLLDYTLFLQWKIGVNIRDWIIA